MSEWNEIDADWDLYGYASQKLLALGESELWLDLVQEVAASTHATIDEAWEGMAAGMRGYLESLDGGANGAENLPEPPDFEEKPQKTALKAQETARNDSREKLEDDLFALVQKWHVDRSFWSIYGSVGYAQIRELLDRQAAITERERAELVDQVDVLTAERDQWKDAFEDSERMRLALVDDLDKRDMGIERLKRRRGELMEQVRSLQDELARVRRMG